MNVEWIKVTTNLFSDEKIRLLLGERWGEHTVLGWVRLLCLAGQVNRRGCFALGDGKPMSIRQMAVAMGQDEADTEKVVSRLADYEMLTLQSDGCWKVTNWERYQYQEGMERIREMGRKRMQLYRERQKQAEEAVAASEAESAPVPAKPAEAPIPANTPETGNAAPHRSDDAGRNSSRRWNGGGYQNQRVTRSLPAGENGLSGQTDLTVACLNRKRRLKRED